MEVGETTGQVGGGGLGQGAGIEQAVVTGAGTLSISADIATSVTLPNADQGTFQLLLDGNVVDTHAFGGTGGYSSLSYTGTVPAGTNTIGIDARRGYGISYGDTPFQYIGNVTLGGSAVPEPYTIALLAAVGLSSGAAWLGWKGRRRRGGIAAPGDEEGIEEGILRFRVRPAAGETRTETKTLRRAA